MIPDHFSLELGEKRSGFFILPQLDKPNRPDLSFLGRHSLARQLKRQLNGIFRFLSLNSQQRKNEGGSSTESYLRYTKLEQASLQILHCLSKTALLLACLGS